MNLDEESISEFLLLGYVLDNKSFQKGKKAKIKTNPPKFQKKENVTIKDVENVLKNSILKLTKNKNKIGVMLSGGKDARLLLALAKSLKINVTAVIVGDGEKRTEEIAAIKIAKTLKTPYKLVRIPKKVSSGIVTRINKVTEGLIQFSGITPMFLIKDELAKDFDIVLNGNLMTEIMDTCEYRWYDSKNPVDVMIRKHFQGRLILKNEYFKIVQENFISRFKDKSLEEIILETEYVSRMRGINALHKLGCIEIGIPAADIDVISTTFSLPIQKRTNGRLAISILKKSYSEIAGIRSPKTPFPLSYPWWIHYGMQEIKNRYYYFKNGSKIWNGKPRAHKMGMWDQGFFFKYRIGDYVKKSLENIDFYMIKQDPVKQILDNHFSEKKDETTYLAKLVTLKNWLDNNYQKK